MNYNEIEPVVGYGNIMITGQNLAQLRGSGNFNETAHIDNYYQQGQGQWNEQSMQGPQGLHGPQGPQGQQGQIWTNPQAMQYDSNVNMELETYPDPQWGNGKYLQWALTSLVTVPTPLLTFYFSDENVEFIQQRIVEEVYRVKAVKINKQNVSDVLVIMRNKYEYAIQGYINTAYCPSSEGTGLAFRTGGLENQILLLNQAVVEECVKKIVSGIEEYQYYYASISKLPIPMTMAVSSSMKGSKALQQNIGFENGVAKSMEMSSFNQRFNNIM